ncbi:MAG: hypothetical protein RL060_1058 [Bacteroidota bacterium]|jgi:hypothetical protein
MMMNYCKSIWLLLLTVFFVLHSLQAQNDTTAKISFSGYLEAYGSYDVRNPINHERPAFFYSYNKHNEVSINLAYLKVNYTNAKVRANVAFMAGTFPEYNMQNEQGLLKNIFEANAGVKLLKNNSLWLDVGVMPSHIGFESAIGKDCWNLTRSILAENSPYFETGVKLGYGSKNERWYMALLYLNGWQRIQKVKGNQTPAFGAQITYKPSAQTTFNYSNFLGNEQTDSLKQISPAILWRYFHNFYLQSMLSSKFGIIVGLDYGKQQRTQGGRDFRTWIAPVFIMKYIFTDHWRVAIRNEIYNDRTGVMIPVASDNGKARGLQAYSYSLNIDYVINENAMLRFEGRGLRNREKIFVINNAYTNHDYFFTTALAISF